MPEHPSTSEWTSELCLGSGDRRCPESTELHPCGVKPGGVLDRLWGPPEHRALTLRAGLQGVSKQLHLVLHPGSSSALQGTKRPVLPLGTRVKEMLSRRWTNSSRNAKSSSWEGRDWGLPSVLLMPSESLRRKIEASHLQAREWATKVTTGRRKTH